MRPDLSESTALAISSSETLPLGAFLYVPSLSKISLAAKLLPRLRLTGQCTSQRYRSMRSRSCWPGGTLKPVSRSPLSGRSASSSTGSQVLTTLTVFRSKLAGA